MGLVIEPREIPPAYLTYELGRSGVRTALRSGEYTQARRGAIVPAPPVGTPWQEAEAQTLGAIAAVAKKLRNGAVFSHASAALIHGLWLMDIPVIPEVTQESRPNSHGRTSLRRHRTFLGPEQVTSVNGLDVTTIERTIVDCACTMPPRSALVVADSGLRVLLDAERSRKSFHPDALEELRRRLLRILEAGPRRGRRQARAVINAADPHSESPQETSVRWITISRGMPAPITQMAIVTRGGTFYADLGWRWVLESPDGARTVWTVLVEYDGEVKYLPSGGIVGSGEEAAGAVLAEKRREDLIREHPRTIVVRVSKEDTRDPDRLFARILAALPPEVRATIRLQPIPELLIGTASRS